MSVRSPALASEFCTTSATWEAKTNASDCLITKEMSALKEGAGSMRVNDEGDQLVVRSQQGLSEEVREENPIVVCFLLNVTYGNGSFSDQSEFTSPRFK